MGHLSDLPPGVSVKDIEDQIADEEDAARRDAWLEEHGELLSKEELQFIREQGYLPSPSSDTLQDTEIQRQWSLVNAFFNTGFVQGEDIWLHLSGGTDLKAVYLCERDGKAGVAVSDFEDGWLPVEAKYEKISLRLDD